MRVFLLLFLCINSFALAMAPALSSTDLGSASAICFSQPVRKEDIINAFTSKNNQKLNSLYKEHVAQLFSFKKSLINAVFLTLAENAFVINNPFNNDSIKRLIDTSDDIMTAFDVQEFCDSLNDFLRNNNYTMSHLFCLPVQHNYDDINSIPNITPCEILHTFGHNQAICFIAFSHFNDEVINNISKKIDWCFKTNSNIVFDLTKNGGGEVSSLINLLSIFFPPYTIIGIAAIKELIEKVYGDPSAHYDKKELVDIVINDENLAKFRLCTVESAIYRPASYTGKIAIMIEKMSASAAENFSHSMRYAGATLIGRPTLGQALLCSSHYLRDASSSKEVLKITYPIGEFIHVADGVSLEGRGIAPDLSTDQHNVNECLYRWLTQSQEAS